LWFVWQNVIKYFFEHNNCRSIKVFYYETKMIMVIKDNYTEIIQNISRHFNKKKLMREKIVNKTLVSLYHKLTSF
jgi:transcriptional regulator